MISTQFLFAGRAIFTVTNTKRNTRLTFKIERPDEFRGEFFASVMKGSDNETDYRYVGMVREATGVLRETKGSKFRAGSPEFEGLRLVLHVVTGKLEAPPALDIQHAGRCGRCGRTLTVPESIELGIGPDCAEEMGFTIPRVTKPVARLRTPEEVQAGMRETIDAIASRREALSGPAFEMPEPPAARPSLRDLASLLQA